MLGIFIFIDLSKASDTVDNSMLINLYGLKETA